MTNSVYRIGTAPMGHAIDLASNLGKSMMPQTQIAKFRICRQVAVAM